MRLWAWYSPCSAHHVRQPGCPRCDAGSWVFLPKRWIGQQVFRRAPRLWRWWVNRG